MEDVLDLYAEAIDVQRPVVCLDEYPLALRRPTRPDLPLRPHRARRHDYEYERCGSCTLFAAFQPLTGWRAVQARDRRTAQDFAWFLKDIVDARFPTARCIRLVLDNLNTHTPAALYATFPPAEARRIAQRLEWHYTPPHGSWLNMIEIEWSVLAEQCLGNRWLADRASVQHEVDAWAAARNAARATVRWRLTTRDVRRALASSYPVPAATTAHQDQPRHVQTP